MSSTMNYFEQFGLSNQLFTAIDNMGIVTPTQIQEETIPLIMKGKDVIGESATGSGKTLAFGCGIVDHVEPGKGISSLILTPTRELCEQVKESLRVLSKHKQLKIISVYGGVSINPQIDDLRNADVVVATPGRLLDHMERRTVNLSRVKILVLDEADRMFDMGFFEDVEKIIRYCPTERQTMFFSATITQRIKDLASRYMKDPIKIMAQNQVDPSLLHQVYYNVTRANKFSMLVHLCKAEAAGLVMIFCNTRRSTDFVVKNLRMHKLDAVSIHGGLSQNKRASMLKLFNTAKVGFLVCTDVAARGLHIDNVSHVYNYEVPKDSVDYVHRIGRTARAGEEGIVVNLISDLDYDNFSRVLSDYRFNVKKMESPKIQMLDVKKEGGFRGRGNDRGSFRGRGQGQGRGGFGRGPSRDGGRSDSRGESWGPRGSSRGSGSRFSRDRGRSDSRGESWGPNGSSRESGREPQNRQDSGRYGYGQRSRSQGSDSGDRRPQSGDFRRGPRKRFFGKRRE